ncbi:hypothetical protein ADIARSV_3474 [Arcticibacter svalbardensis MN12-7]|uniref:Uncharacterized protein n=1 Tax=Arcticibacter svalbardensis MN12-7 TaxID=1150600 RepID=R9GPC3_9SPHI|nr:hypothetical protein [Arcticibacter svalbardensis]EOR93395.1 hypothetical protein ADIARSV_3474 [Arcticibacter svalbardensis MN12-7]
MFGFTPKWLTISFFNLLLVASLGIILRYKIAFYLPFVEQKFALHSHSHFAFSGWITQTLMVLLIHYLSLNLGPQIVKRYYWLLYANLITAYGMMVSFMLQGYGLYSITFSSLSIVVSYFFAIYYWKDLAQIKLKKVSHLWFKVALLFSVISSIGVFSLAYMMANAISNQNGHLSAIYFFLHFQYNGWFFFAGMGLLVSRLEQIKAATKTLRLIFILFCFACLPAYFLSIMWIKIPGITYITLVAAVAQLIGWGLMLKLISNNRAFIRREFSKPGLVLLLLSAIALSIKLLLQSASVHPALSQLSYSFRPIVIGYLHLVLLAVISVFIIGYILSFKLVPVKRNFLTGVCVFVIGIIINEILLMMQGITALNYTIIPHIDLMLFTAAIILFAGIAMMFYSCIKNRVDVNPKQ